ncbi:hypothetical protein BBJ28_00004257 [Nothophytophthora sp. Chile5]|nr:hypothetical protein BBJ28_00004257 [Nothophytophthora sp. Chile5]
MDVVGNELVALNELLTGCQDAQDDYQEQITPYTLGGAANGPEGVLLLHSLWPGLVLPSLNCDLMDAAVTRPIGQIQVEDPKAIWRMDEVPSDDEDDDTFETRQSVMTEDVFLGLSDKDPSSAHCEAMVVRVSCPEHQLEDIELDVTHQKLLLLSSTLRLVLHLPYPVRHLDGQAKWDHASHSLSVTLPIIRDEW